MTRRQKDARLAGVVTVGCLVVAAFAAGRLLHGYSPRQMFTFPFAPSITELRRLGEPIVAALQRRFAERGRYPARLDELDLAVEPTFYGAWNYQPLRDGAACELSISDYGRYGFVVFWTSGSGWSFDA